MEDRRRVRAGGLSLAYRVAGPVDGRPLVLLHALGKGADDWAGVLPSFTGHRRTYALDLRGHGDSDRPGGGAGANPLERMRDDVYGFLDALGLERVDLLGHSMGGVVAYLLAARHPERVDRLVLEDVGAPLPRPRVVPERPAGRLPFDWETVLAVREQIDTPDPDWLQRLARITAPCLVLAGGPDSPVPQERVAELARRIPDARMRTVPAGHLVHATEPEAFTAAVLGFLDG